MKQIEVSTQNLVARAQSGDLAALDALAAEYLPRMRRWAAGRLPRGVRDLTDTQDLVQEAVIGAFRNIARFECRGEGALQAYLRQAIINRIREEIRRAGRRPGRTALDPNQRDGTQSPLDLAIAREALDRYETALARLSAIDRQAVVLRLELGFAFGDVAAALGKTSASAARSTVTRALARLAAQMAAVK